MPTASDLAAGAPPSFSHPPKVLQQREKRSTMAERARTLAGMTKGTIWGAALCAVGLLSATARADECGSDQTVSCHVTQPNKDQVNMGGVVPLGNYTPFVWREGRARVEPPANPNNEPFGGPGIEITLGAGGWGEGGSEPMAIARSTVQMLVSDGVYGYFRPLTGTGLNFDCPDGPVLCAAGSAGNRLLQTASSQIRRRYRVRQTNPATLPSAVTSVPVMLDYRVGIYMSSTSDFGPGIRDGLTSSVSVSFGSLTSSRKVRVECSGGSAVSCSVNGDVYAPIAGKRLDGTLTYFAPVAALDKLMLVLGVANYVEPGACVDVMTPEGIHCLVKPWRGSGHGVADPYLYIDPSWQYASWFTVEVSADETDTSWVTPRRTNVDLETLTGLVEGDGGVGRTDAGTAADDAGAGADDAGEQPADQDAGASAEEDAGGAGGQPRRDVGAGGEEEEDPEPRSKSGGGCQLAPGAEPLAGGLLLLVGAALVRRRRRAGR